MATAVLTNGTARLEITDFEDCDTLADVLDLYRDTVNIASGSTIALDGEPVENPADVSVDDLDGVEISATKTAGSKGQ